MRLSVVIPVYNDQDRLESCLNALADQTLPTDDFEVVVVDNGSRVPITLPTAPNTRIVTEQQPGSYAARNMGLEHASGEILVFTDSDCIPHPTWLAKGLEYLDTHPDMSRVGGRIAIFTDDPDHRTPAEVYETVHGFPQEHYVTDRGFAATANLFVRRSVFEDIGPFNAELRSGGDVEFGLRATNAGSLIGYSDDVVVRHPARRTLKELHGKQRRTIAGARDLAIYLGERPTATFKGVPRSLIPPIPTVVGVLRDTEVGPFIDRLKFGYATVTCHYTRALFKVRLLLGAESPR